MVKGLRAGTVRHVALAIMAPTMWQGQAVVFVARCDWANSYLYPRLPLTLVRLGPGSKVVAVFPVTILSWRTVGRRARSVGKCFQLDEEGTFRRQLDNVEVK